MSDDYQFTFQEVERILNSGMKGRVVSFITIRDKQETGVLQFVSLSEDRQTGEAIVHFMLDRIRYQADLFYFIENTTIHYGDTYRGNRPDVRGLFQRNR